MPRSLTEYIDTLDSGEYQNMNVCLKKIYE